MVSSLDCGVFGELQKSAEVKGRIRNQSLTMVPDGCPVSSVGLGEPRGTNADTQSSETAVWNEGYKQRVLARDYALRGYVYVEFVREPPPLPHTRGHGLGLSRTGTGRRQPKSQEVAQAKARWVTMSADERKEDAHGSR